MNIVMVFTSKPLETMIKEGGAGYWSANKKRLEKCTYIVATKSNTLREHFPNDIDIKRGSAFLIGKISNIAESPKGDRLIIQFAEYTEVNIPNAWPGNRNPVAYTKVESFQAKHGIDLSTIKWQAFPEKDVDSLAVVQPLTVDEAKNGLAKSLGIDPSCIEIQIKV